MGPDMHTRGIVPEKEWLVGFYGAIHKVVRSADKLGINVLHVGFGFRVHIRTRWQRAAVRDGLLANSAPAWVCRWIVDTCGLGVYNVARTKTFVETRLFWVIIRIGFLRRVEMVEDAIELIEPVHRRQVFTTVAKMIFAD